MRIVVLGETPAKKNEKKFNTRTRTVFTSKRYREWYEFASMQVRAQCPNQPRIKCCCIYLNFIHGDLRKRDGDNGTSTIFDLLKDCGVVEDDNWKNIPLHVVGNGYDKGKARVECVIEGTSAEECERGVKGIFRTAVNFLRAICNDMESAGK